jgi:SPP1 family predicted phage head-tail adaptor
MQAGKLRDRLEIQQLVAGSPQQTSTGHPDETWTQVVELWGDVRPLGGRELFQAQAAASRVDYEIEIRYTTGYAFNVSSAMRAVFKNEVYSIEAVLPFPDVDRMILRCSKGQNDG